jgi:uncharacterized protein (TIGR00304 family)
VNKAIVAGIVLTFLGVLLTALSFLGQTFQSPPTTSVSSPQVQAGGVAIIMIGPIPIVIGGGNPTLVQTGMVVGGALIALFLIISLVSALRARRA